MLRKLKQYSWCLSILVVITCARSESNMVITCKKPCKKKKSTMLTVEQMVDIALGTPEIGAVNFNVLHALIHVIIQQLNIQKCLVEFKGYDSERMEGIILTAKPGPILKLSEYIIDAGDGKTCPLKERTNKKGDEDVGGNEATTRKPACECTGKKKRSVDLSDEKEKTDKGKDDSDVEEKKKSKKEPILEECEEVEEPEPKKIRDYKPKSKTKPCPCKSGTGGVSDSEGANADECLKVVPSSYYGSDAEGTCQTIVRVEPIKERCDSWRSRPALAHESMVKLEEKVAMLQDAFEALEQLPTNEELKKRTQGGTTTPTPVKDLWQLYNLSKRVESCEGTIEKLASMIEDLVKETCNFKEAMLVIADAVDEMECADNSAQVTCCAAVQGQTSSPFQAQSDPSKEKPSTSEVKKPEGQTVKFSPCVEGQPCPEDKEDSKSDKIPPAPAPPPTPTSASRTNTRTISNTNTNPKTSEVEKPNPEAPAEESNATDQDKAERSSQFVEGPAPSTGELLQAQPQHHAKIGPEFNKMSSSEKFCTLKNCINCLTSQLNTYIENFPAQQTASKLCALVSMQRQLDALEKEWRAFLATLGEKGNEGLSKSINDMKSDVDNLNNLVARLIIEKQETDEGIRAILREIEMLKKTKADFEVVEDMLAEKADASAVNKKVSHDQFDAACDDLTRGLDEALEKLMQQEAMWNEAMEELQKDVDNKLDKTEIMPLKEFINKKLKCLQEKLKQLAQLKKDAEAAGAKSRILRNLNCIACDGDVVMKMDNTTSFQRTRLYPSKTLKPLLTFELDQVRKAMKKGPPCRAVNHVEETIFDAQKKSAGLPLTARDAVDNKVSKLAHFCNRYCGGSHTITTPQQRVTRIGHFLTEFGPQAMAMFNQENPCDGRSIQQGLTPSGMVTEEEDFRKSC